MANHVMRVGNQLYIDWEKLQKTTELATEFLDCVVDANAYVEAVPQLREAALNVRRIGLGVMGFADVLYMLGVGYGSEKAQDLAKQIMGFIRYHSIKRSIKMSAGLGEFPAFEGSIYDFNDLDQLLEPVTIESKSNKHTIYFEALQDDLNTYGIRNGAQLTVAPTGTISTVAGDEGYGCEPVFALGYIRHMVGNDGEDIELEYLSPIFEATIDDMFLDEDLYMWERDLLKTEAAKRGTIQHVDAKWDNPGTIEYLKRVFVVAGDIAPEEHVKMQAAFQVYVDNSLSKTINMPNSATVQDVEDAYMLAWKTGCKGITVYREGSRDLVVLETKAEKERKEQNAEAPHRVQAAPEAKQQRAQVLSGKTFKQDTPAGTAYVTINELDGEPFEVFVTLGKGGSEVNAVCEAIGRSISLYLRTYSPVQRRLRLMWLAEELHSIGGGRSMGFGTNRVVSIPDGVAKALKLYLYGKEEVVTVIPSDTGYAPGDLCSDCGNSTLINTEGCRKCAVCGYSEC